MMCVFTHMTSMYSILYILKYNEGFIKVILLHMQKFCGHKYTRT